MNRDEKRGYNEENESTYYYAPFTEQRRDLRKRWATTRKDWNTYLYLAEMKHIKQISEAL